CSKLHDKINEWKPINRSLKKPSRLSWQMPVLPYWGWPILLPSVMPEERRKLGRLPSVRSCLALCIGVLAFFEWGRLALLRRLSEQAKWVRFGIPAFAHCCWASELALC